MAQCGMWHTCSALAAIELDRQLPAMLHSVCEKHCLSTLCVSLTSQCKHIEEALSAAELTGNRLRCW